MVKENLIRLRKDKKFSQQDVAEYLNISQTQYLRKEKGEIEIKEEEWERIAKLLDVEVDVIKQDDSSNKISQNFENITGSYVGSNNNYFSIPEHLLDSQKEYIELLKKEIEVLKNRISELEK